MLFQDTIFFFAVSAQISKYVRFDRSSYLSCSR